METILAQALGVAAFLAGSVWLGRRVRRRGAESEATRAGRISHLLFWACVLLPGVVGFFHPGLGRYDELLGLPPLPLRTVALVLGVSALVIGLGLGLASNYALIRLGKGSAAFLLTEQLVSGGVYRRTRNPMSLGFYLACLGVGLTAGSLAVTVGVLVVIAVHAFNLRYFEERELELRYGRAYVEYRRRVPFLLPKLRRG